MGYDEIESKILSSLIKNKLLTADEIEERSGVSKSKVYQVLKVMDERGFTFKTDDRPASYFITDRFIENIEKNMDKMYYEFKGKLESVKLSTKKESFENILEIFKQNGYIINEAQPLPKQLESLIPFSPGSLQPNVLFDFIAEGDLKLAISIIDKSKEKFCESLLNREEILSHIVYSASQQLECVSFCLFISRLK